MLPPMLLLPTVFPAWLKHFGAVLKRVLLRIVKEIPIPLLTNGQLICWECYADQ
jgi:hypothetical protein